MKLLLPHLLVCASIVSFPLPVNAAILASLDHDGTVGDEANPFDTSVLNAGTDWQYTTPRWDQRYFNAVQFVARPGRPSYARLRQQHADTAFGSEHRLHQLHAVRQLARVGAASGSSPRYASSNAGSVVRAAVAVLAATACRVIQGHALRERVQ